MIQKLSLLALAALALTGAASAQVINVDLPGNTSTDRWDLDNWNYGSNPRASFPGYYGMFPGSDAWDTEWNNAAPSSEGSAGRSGRLYVVETGGASGPFVASGSLYFGGSSSDQNVKGGTIGVTADAIADVKTIVFQIRIGEASGFDFFDNESPKLMVSSGGLISEVEFDFNNLISRVDAGQFTPPGQSEQQQLYINTYYLQWSILDPIDSFEILFSAVEHSQVYVARLDQSDVAMPIPEPSTWALLGAGIAGTAFLRRRRKG